MKKTFFFSMILCIIAIIPVFPQSVTGSTSNLNSSLLRALKEFARLSNRDIVVNSGYRSVEHQQQLWDDLLANGGHINTDPVCTLINNSDRVRGDGNMAHSADENYKVAKPGYSKHETGDAADINGLSRKDCAKLNKAGLGHTVPGEIWHVELTDGSCYCH